MQICHHPEPGPSRRRFLHLVAAVGVCSVGGIRNLSASEVHRWDGSALGADASITLGGISDGEASGLISECLAEMERLEAEFSLYREGSALVRLNRDGVLERPSADFVEILDLSQAISSATNGVFDPTVQPLWFAYTRGAGAKADVEAAKALVGFQYVSWNAERVAFAREQMAMTLNGIAQGYITDKVADLLRTRGLTSVLVNIGEYRALGAHPDARPWQVGIQDPHRGGSLIDLVALTDESIATSGGYGAVIGPGPEINHLFDPRSGLSADRYSSVSVRHPRAAMADGLSTAFSFLSENEIREAVSAFIGARVLLVRPDGSITRI